MDFSKLLKDTAPEMGSNLTIKIGNPPSLTVRKCFCMWSDLLGFGSLYTLSNPICTAIHATGKIKKIQIIVSYNTRYPNKLI